MHGSLRYWSRLVPQYDTWYRVVQWCGTPSKGKNQKRKLVQAGFLSREWGVRFLT